MPELSQLALFIAAAFIVIVIPGPNILYLVTRSIDQGRSAGFASMLGIETASLVHLALATAGLTSLLMAAPGAYTFLRYAGAVFLLFLGLRKLRERDNEMQAEPSRTDGTRGVFAQGFLVNLLNPKTALFFIAVLPQFVHTDHGNARTQLIVYGVLLIVLAVLIETAYVFFSARLGIWMAGRKDLALYQRRVAGSIYIGLGLVTGLTGLQHR